MVKTILVLTANPKNTPPLRIDQEVREIHNGLQRSQKRDEFILRQQWASRPIDVRRAMLDYKPNIVHFCGHGSSEEGIVFEDEQGLVKLVSTDALTGFFKLFANQVECVVLNACYSEIQAQAIAKHISFVVGMDKAIGDNAAIEFAVAFYDAIGAGETVEFAYRLACNAIQWAGLPEHLTPILKKQKNELSGNKNISQPLTSRHEEGELTGTWELEEKYEFGNTTGALQLLQSGNLLSGTIMIYDRLDDGEEYILQEDVQGTVQESNLSLTGTKKRILKGNPNDYELDKWTGVIANHDLIKGYSEDRDGTTGSFTLKRTATK